LLEESLRLWPPAGDPWGPALTLLQLGVVAEDSGDYDRAEPLIEEARALFRADANAIWVATTHYHLAIVAYGRGDLARATALGEQARAQFQEAGDAWGAAVSGDLLGLVAVERGDPRRAAASFTEDLPVLQELGQPESLLCRLAGVATLAVATGRAQVAARLFGAAVAMAEGIGFAFDLPARATFERAAAAGRARLGEAAFAAAWGAGRALPVEAAVAEALELATALATAPSTLPRASLSPREAEILPLLAEGKTDREIAAALYLSPRTVEHHVAHVLAKLGVATRAAAAEAGVAAGLVPPALEPPA
jgi:non-specific serine/threonine protein kinase